MNYRMSDSAPLYAMIIALSPVLFVVVLVLLTVFKW